MSVTFLTSEDEKAFVKSINGVKPDPETGDVAVSSSGSGGNANQGTGWTTEQINLLDQLFDYIPWTASGAGAIADNLIASLRGGDSGEEEPDEPVVPDEPDTPEVTLTSISATYSGGDVAVGTAVSALTGIVVTAHYSDGTSATVTGYTLSGTIAEGSNTVTVSYGGKSTTFAVTGVAESGGEDEPGDSTVEIPAEATRLAYIESTGTQYIDTGYVGADSDEYEITVEMETPTNTDWEYIFGASDGTNNMKYAYKSSSMMHTSGQRTDYKPLIETLFTTSPVKFTVKTVYNAIYPTYRFYRYYDTSGAEIAGASTVQRNNPKVNLFLFAFNNSGTVQNYGKVKLYEFILYDANGAEIHHYVPVKDANGIVCLYDTVNKQYLYNAGTGDFVGGEAA